MLAEMSDEEVVPEVYGLELLMSCEKHDQEEARRKRKLAKRKTSQSPERNGKKSVEEYGQMEQLQKNDEEAELEDIVFGGNVWEKIETELAEQDEVSKRKAGLFILRVKKPHREDKSDDEAIEEVESNVDEVTRKSVIERKPVWEDEDDQFILDKDRGGALSNNKTLSARLREKHEQIFVRPKWAIQAEKKLRDEEADQLLRTAAMFIDKDTSARPLSPGLLDFSRCPQMNKFCFQRSPLVALAFHPSSEIAMVAHKNGAVIFLSVDAKECSKIQSVYFKDFDISCAKLSYDGMQMMAGSIRYRTLHCYDLMSGTRTQVTFPKAHELTHMKRFEVSPCGRYLAIHGRFGNVYVICAETKQQLATLKMNEDVTSTVFTRDGRMISHGGNYMYLWDIGARRCIQKFLDDGCLKGQSLALSPDERLLATGCNSGIVNVYNVEQLLKGREASRTPKPLKCVKNIVTPLTTLAFNPSSEILLAASRYKPEAVKMVHTGTLTAFSNFPSVQHKFNTPSCAAFSPNGGFVALGTTIGAANLGRINHYGNY
ncbi:hypothetical protein BIW11_12688 [Tropilaelaps mercedesae]|uniref:U3 small nucleolar RNA-associated protein 18-like n=1 Tax=Tropilaelaps mercedesae TaxID=418985 RepID=A0A1V9X5B1_9ACAR|nr:hypothetical protein BIW11_12688 [Tropilaelaps mercedesae]